MKKPVITQEDKKLVGYLTKKKKQSGKFAHVYYNRKKNGQSSYITGWHNSIKSSKRVKYRSSYELRFFQLLDQDQSVRSYESESVKVPYIDLEGKKRIYVPDVVVLKSNGDIEVCEVKPKAMLDNLIVQRKANACKIFFKKLLGDSSVKCTFKFVTEEDLFTDAVDYSTFIKSNARG